MAYQDTIERLAIAPVGTSSRLRRTAIWLLDWATACVEHYAAAATYEELARLSDAELRRRGLDRATLAQDLFRCTTRDHCR